MCKSGLVNDGDVTTIKVTEEAILLLIERLLHFNDAIDTKVVSRIKETIALGVNVTTLDMTVSFSDANVHEFMQKLATEFSKLKVIKTILHKNLIIPMHNTFFLCIQPSVSISKETVLSIILMAQTHRAEEVINQFCWNEVFLYPTLDCN